MPSQPPLGVVIVSLNEGASLLKTTKNLQATLPRESEIVIVDDGSDDGSADFAAMAGRSGRSDSVAAVRLFRASNLGVARARNFGPTHGGRCWSMPFTMQPSVPPRPASRLPTIHTSAVSGCDSKARIWRLNGSTNTTRSRMTSRSFQGAASPCDATFSRRLVVSTTA
jgi:hypothetical protein